MCTVAAPARTLERPSSFVTDRSACACTVVWRFELLLPTAGSVVDEATDAVLKMSVLSGVPAGTVALIVTTTLPPAASVPMPSEPGHGLLGVQLLPRQNFPPVSGDGSESVMTTLCASEGPPLETASV